MKVAQWIFEQAAVAAIASLEGAADEYRGAGRDVMADAYQRHADDLRSGLNRVRRDRDEDIAARTLADMPDRTVVPLRARIIPLGKVSDGDHAA